MNAFTILEHTHRGRCVFIPLRESVVIPGGQVLRCRCGRIRVRPPADSKRSA